MSITLGLSFTQSRYSAGTNTFYPIVRMSGPHAQALNILRAQWQNGETGTFVSQDHNF